MGSAQVKRCRPSPYIRYLLVQQSAIFLPRKIGPEKIVAYALSFGGKSMFVFSRTLHTRLQVLLATVFFLLIAQAGLSVVSPEPQPQLGQFNIESLIRNPGY